MSKKGGGFNSAAKSRIASAESRQHGHIRPGSFAAKVQRIVDTRASTPSATMPTTASVKK